MQKIKIINNSFELPYLNEEDRDYSLERSIVQQVINLIDNYSCFIAYSCEDEIFSNFKILNYIKLKKFRKIIEVENIEINDRMFEGRYVVIYFMPNNFKFKDFISIKAFENIFKKYGAKLIVGLDDLGYVLIKYNKIYDQQIRKIIKQENIK